MFICFCFAVSYAGASRPACSMLSVLSVPPMAGFQRAANGQALSTCTMPASGVGAS